jgi:AP-1 complex subunit beta-1
LRICSLADSAKTALQTVAAGQAVENLLDFDDEPAPEGPTGLAATQVLQQPAAKNILSGTSANPLDDLVSIFGNTSLSPSAPIPSAAAPATDPFGVLGGVSSPTAPPPPTTLNQQEDLLGLF